MTSVYTKFKWVATACKAAPEALLSLYLLTLRSPYQLTEHWTPIIDYLSFFLPHTHTHTHTHICTHTNTITQTHTMTHAHTYTNTHTCTHAHAHTHTHSHTTIHDPCSSNETRFISKLLSLPMNPTKLKSRVEQKPLTNKNNTDSWLLLDKGVVDGLHAICRADQHHRGPSAHHQSQVTCIFCKFQGVIWVWNNSLVIHVSTTTGSTHRSTFLR